MNCTLPDARLTVVGSTASRFGPREVAIGCTVEAGVAVKSRAGVAVNPTMLGGAETASGERVEVPCGAQAANKTATRPIVSNVERLGRGSRRFLLIWF